LVVRSRGRIFPDDFVVDCSKYRLAYEFVLQRRGDYAVGKYGVRIAKKWLRSIGVQVVETHVMRGPHGEVIRPDLFEESSRTAFEVKTGMAEFSAAAEIQIKHYEFAVKTSQACKVVYVNVAFMGRVGPVDRLRERLRKFGFKLVILA
jgi:hypothetical protein